MKILVSKSSQDLFVSLSRINLRALVTVARIFENFILKVFLASFFNFFTALVHHKLS